MTESRPTSQPNDPRVQAALQDYLERVDRGDAVDQEEFLAEHPDIADELRSFIATDQNMARRAGLKASASSSVARRDAETMAPQRVQGKSAVTDSGQLPPQFGRYRILKPLGSGAMGTVYLAEDTQLQRKVALKTPRFDEDDSGELLERFYREARSAATLRHSNICPVFDVGEIDGRHFISMAYIEGRPLSAYIQPDNPQPERQILLIIRKLALALREAHEHGIVHRDLKPGNVMIDPRGEPIIMDFGLARSVATDDDHRITRSGVLVGSPAYMSPEQVEGDPDRIGPASDQYSLGVILYELLTGQLPFRGSITGVIGQILTKQPTRPGQLRAGLDPRIEALCRRMMAKPADDRFPSIRDVPDEVARILKTPSPSSAATEGSANAATPAQRHVAAPSITASNVESLYEAARKCMRKRDYDQAIQILETLPEHKRNEEVVRLLNKARQLSDEVQFLLAEIDEALRLNDAETALKKAEELLELKPGHHRAKQVREECSRYGRGLLFWSKRRTDDGRRVGEGSWIPWAAIGVFLIAFSVTSWFVYDYLRSEGTLLDPSTVAEIEGEANASVEQDREVPDLAPTATGGAGDPAEPVPDLSVANAQLNAFPFPENATFTDARTLSELNEPGVVNAYPWIAPDGLTLYWTREGDGTSSIRQATRASIDAPFGNARTVLSDARLASVSPDGQEVVCLFDADANGETVELCSGRRSGFGDAFPRPVQIESLQSLNRPKGTAFSADGLSLLILESGDPAAGSQNRVLISHRPGPTAEWGPAEPLTIQGHVDEDALTWPSFDASEDHLLFSYSEPGTRYLEWGGVADRTADPLTFDNSRPLLLDGERFVTRGGRYCATTGELFYTHPIGSRPYQEMQLWVARSERALPAPYEILTAPEWEWSEPRPLGPAVNNEYNNHNARESADGLTLIFSSDRPGGSGQLDLWMCTRPSVEMPWTEPVNLGEAVNSTNHEYAGYVSSDGLALLISSGRGGVEHRLWMTERSSVDEPWPEPTQLGEPVPSEAGGEYFPTLTADGLTLVFASNRPGAVAGEPSGFWNEFNLWTTSRNSIFEPWLRPVPIGNLNTPGFDGCPFLTPDGRVLLFGSGAQGERRDIYVSTRASSSEPWSPAVNLGPRINNEDRNDGPALSADGTRLLFTRLSDFGTGRSPWRIMESRLVPTTDDTSPPSIAPAGSLQHVSLAAVPATLTNDPMNVGFPRPDILVLNPPDHGEAAGTFHLQRAFVSFSVLPRIQPARGAGDASPLTFSVLGDGNLLWESEPVTSANDQQTCQVDVRNVSVLQLKVRRRGQARTALATWFQPRLSWEVPEGLPPRPQAPWPVPLSILDTLDRQDGAWPIKFTGADWLGMHPPRDGASRIRFRLGNQFEWFRSIVRVGREVGGVDPAGVITFRAFGDGKLLWKSREFRTGRELELCDVNVAGVDVLELHVTCSGPNQAAHAYWYQPYVFSTPLSEIDFEFEEDNEGWFAAQSMSPVAVEDGVLRSRVLGRDPYLTRTFLNVAPDQYSRIVVRMRISGSHDNSGAVSWQTASQPLFSDARYVSFETNPDGEFHDYVIEVGEHELWQGQRIKGLRLDPEFRETVAATIEIDSIRGE